MPMIATIEQLEAIYGQPNEASTVKVADRITPSYRVLIDKSPFVALATCGPEGLDCSPRGDLPGFVRVHDQKTLMMPDRRGNNRIDSLRNIVRDPRIALLFLIPGAGSTLRVNGRAQVSNDDDLLASFEMDGKAPRTVRPGMAGARAPVAVVTVLAETNRYLIDDCDLQLENTFDLHHRNAACGLSERRLCHY
jgi:predicted pyridoxine 5'-phosphate oxidase superfamily flavin-nucleotide-binding protein